MLQGGRVSCWAVATLQVFPLEADSGFGPILKKTLAAAQTLAGLTRECEQLELVVEPDPDIVCFYPLPADGDRRTSSISTITQRMFTDLMNNSDDPLSLATLQVKPVLLADRGLDWDTDNLIAFRSVLMKPGHLGAVEVLQQQVVAAIARDHW